VRAYRADVGGKPLRAVTLADLQRFADSLGGAESSFAAKLGAVPFNVGAALRKPKTRDTLADRILDEQQVSRVLALSDGRDHALVRLAYAGGFRVSELVSLRWSDCADAADGCMFATVFGKGGKTRVVRISAATSKVLRALRADAALSGHIFTGRNGGLSPLQAWRIVRAAAKCAGIEKPVSPHFLRHAHALERGAKVTTVRDTLGHSSIAITDRYAHAQPGESSEAVLPV
jgi:integrase/recombinase XerD